MRRLSLRFCNGSPTHEPKTKLSGSITRRPGLKLNSLCLSGRRIFFDHSASELGEMRFGRAATLRCDGLQIFKAGRISTRNYLRKQKNYCTRAFGFAQ
jgi:hypothetical protein